MPYQNRTRYGVMKDVMKNSLATLLGAVSLESLDIARAQSTDAPIYHHHTMNAASARPTTKRLTPASGKVAEQARAKIEKNKKRTIPTSLIPKRQSKAGKNEVYQVTGTRRTHGNARIVGSEFLSQGVPGTNPLKILARLPGIMFQSYDAQGIDLWSNQVYIHGFSQNQIGMTLDGIPLGDQQYASLNGLNSVNAISAENIENIAVSTSAGSETVASTSNLGGALQYHSIDPSEKRRAIVSQAFGSNSTFHTYVKLDSGKINQTGTRFYISYMRNDAQKWKGGGNQFMQQMNFKFLQPIRERSSFSIYYDWSDVQSQAYQDYSFNMLKVLGSRIDNFVGTPDGYTKAYEIALAYKGLPGGKLPPGYDSLSDPWDASYYESSTLRRDNLGGASLNLELSKNIRWDSVFYGHSDYGRGSWITPYLDSPNGAPVALQVSLDNVQRFGFTSALRYDVDHHHIRAGVWYENIHSTMGRSAYEEPLLGEGSPLNSLGSLPKPFDVLWKQALNSNTFTGYIEDTFNVLKNLELHAGFRSILENTHSSQIVNTPSYTGAESLANGGMTTSKPFLPHFSADWHFLSRHELFIDVANNAKAYTVAGYNFAASPFSVSQEAFDRNKGKLRPETDWNYALGYRYLSKILSADLYLYHTDFKNRLQQVTSGSVINPVSEVRNVGSVAMNGVDAGFVVRPVDGLSIYNSISYSHSVYGGNINESGVVYHTKGSQVVAYPRFMYKAGISYSWRQLYLHLDTQYIGQRNYSYTGDTKIPGYWYETLGARYKIGKFFGLTPEKLSVDFNIYNLTNNTYISTMGESGFPMSQPSAETYQSFFIGAPRQYFGSIRAEF